MKIDWSGKIHGDQVASTWKSEGKTFHTDRIRIGHNRAEVYLQVGGIVILLSPGVAKKFRADLAKEIDGWEEEHGAIEGSKKKQDSSPKQVIKSLYKSKKVSSNLISINTKRKKRLPPKGK